MIEESVFSRTIHYDPDKEIQIRLTVNEFSGVQYMHIRKYFMDFYGDWVPTKDGISMPLSISCTLSLFLALSEMMSEAEKDLIDESLKGIIKQYTEELDNDIPF